MVEVEAPGEKPLGILSGCSVREGRLQSDVATPNEPQPQPYNVRSDALKCPECGNTRVFHDGFRKAPLNALSSEPIQRYRCADYGHRFSEHQSRQILKSQAAEFVSSQQNNPCKEIDLLAALEKEKASAGINTTQQGLILEFQWKMKKRQLADVTITSRTIWLNQLVKLGADLRNPDTVETVLATEEISTPTKCNIVKTYTAFTKAFKINWDPVKIRYDAKEAFDPLEEEIDQLIAGCGKVTAAFLQTLKDTGARIGEIRQLQWTDINEKNSTIAINHPGKGSRTRTVRVSAKTIGMLKNLSKKNGDYVFCHNSVSTRASFEDARKRLAERMQNPRLLKIHFHTLRHWRASREYEKTGDIYAVKDLLGHKSLMSTDRYQHSNYSSEEYITKRPKTSQEEDALINIGFDYVRFDDKDQVPIYRKRK